MNAINPKNQKTVSRVLKLNAAYEKLNQAENRNDSKCEKAFNKLIDEWSNLPKYEQQNIYPLTYIKPNKRK